jgi:polar amino acid transport system substrate-binding protein
VGRLELTRQRLTSPAIFRRALGSASAALLLAAGLTGCGSGGGGATTAALQPKVVKAGTLTVCTSFGYAPFEFKKDGKPMGFDIDLADEVAKQLGLKAVFVNADFDDIQSGQVLNEGECDVAVAGITIRGDRARVVDFSSPYFDAGQAMVVKQGSDASSLDDLADQKIGVQDGTTGQLYVTDNAPKTAKIVPFDDASQVTDALRTGAVEAGIYDNTVVGDVVAKNPRLEVAAEFDTGEQYGMAVKKDSSVDLLRFINNVLADLKQNGGYDALYNRWFRGSTAL